jgi:hypothetical protein
VCLHLWGWARGLQVLHRVGRLDWDSIEPSILVSQHFSLSGCWLIY